MIMEVITVIGLMASIITIFEFGFKYRRNCTKQSHHANIKCRFFKDYDKKSYLIFYNEGECTAYNIKIHGLDQFFVKPLGKIPPSLDVSEQFRLSLYLITKESNRMITLSISWSDDTQEVNLKELSIPLS